jgi:hypothetical protein
MDLVPSSAWTTMHRRYKQIWSKIVPLRRVGRFSGGAIESKVAIPVLGNSSGLALQGTKDTVSRVCDDFWSETERSRIVDQLPRRWRCNH